MNFTDEELTFTLEDVAGINYYNFEPTMCELLKGAHIVYAVYETGRYEGGWCVIFIKDGKWYVDEGVHCSCNGPKWNPIEITKDKLFQQCEPYLGSKSRVQACIRKAEAAGY